ncbi:glycoside hydrolase family 47 protein [Periconia macrospinosa]|uniref:alpha-1,2-Mannosidase n=1 Tax=Periconia macrospinosa TaxID=97972 RepID=A0A2V1E8S0_9PLEO|nr:glycoside hydrolase family 47 protein [Periconia macrospinosa]
MPRLKRFGLGAILLVCILYVCYSLSFGTQGASSIATAYESSGGLVKQHGDAASAGKLQPHKKPEKSEEQKSTSWADIPLRYPVQSMVALPSVKPLALPRIQHQFPDRDAKAIRQQATRQDDIKKQFLKCWNSYKERAWMHDELQPVAGGYRDPFGGWAATLVDSLDTLWIMGLHDEFKAAIPYVEKIDFGNTSLQKINVFETNIRHLGGLLAAYELSEERRLLVKAKEVGEMLYHAFDTPNNMPTTRWNMLEKAAGVDQVADEIILLAELGSFTLEFTRLSQATGDPKWYDAANRITQLLAQQQMKTKLPGMWPIGVNAKTMDLTERSTFTLGSMSDSTYEYFAKTHALLGGTDPVYEQLYNRAMETAINHTLYRPMNPDNLDLLATGHIDVNSEDGATTLTPELQHLTCYTGGMFALGGKLFANPPHVEIGRKLTDTCIWAYSATPSGIMPEVSKLYHCPSSSSTTSCTWDKQLWQAEIDSLAAAQNLAPNPRLPPGFTEMTDRRYLLRPEAIESVFIMYRITGEPKYQDAAWDMWTAISTATQTELANSAIWDVLAASPQGGSKRDAAAADKTKQDSMESFWMAETLKYFYLVFADPKVVSLDEWVFNTEAHPLRITGVM